MWQPILVIAVLGFLYAPILRRLIEAWLTDENYSHGVLIPFLMVYLLWLEKSQLALITKKPFFAGGAGLIILAVVLLIAGTLGAELFTQRISLVVMLTGITVYFFGLKTLRGVVVSLVLLALAIPLPTILFNQIAFPLQLLATKFALLGIRAFSIPAAKFGNVIELLPKGASQPIFLEVVEACSGIRSLMTLITLALVYAYFTSSRKLEINDSTWFDDAKNPDFRRTIFLMFAAVPIAVVTNGFRVMTTGILAYNYGEGAAEGFSHEFAGWLVYIVALVLLLVTNKLYETASRVLRIN